MTDILERDAGFCSGGDEDDVEAEDGIHSPTDASEDSVDVKVQPISLRNRNKRKCAEPRKLDTDLPAKKRKIDLSVTEPFRPWSYPEPSSRFPVNLPSKTQCDPRRADSSLEPAEFNVIVSRLPTPQAHTHGVTHFERSQSLIKVIPPHRLGAHSPVHQEEPLSLVSKRKDDESSDRSKVPHLRLSKVKTDTVTDVRAAITSPSWHQPPIKDFLNPKTQPLGRVSDRGNYVKTGKTNGEKKTKGKHEDASHQSDNKFRIDSLLSSEASPSAATAKSSQGGQQRNYKNMTRERRIEANARERTRVHTISAAFDTLRHSIPAYSHNQKLSKLSVLRIACSYIMTLSRMAGYDYSKDQSEPDLSNCVDNVSKTIQTEGKIRKKKDD